MVPLISLVAVAVSVSWAFPRPLSVFVVHAAICILRSCSILHLVLDTGQEGLCAVGHCRGYRRSRIDIFSTITAKFLAGTKFCPNSEGCLTRSLASLPLALILC